MKVLITGASGLLGKAIYDAMYKKHETVGTYAKRERKNFELLNIDEIDSVRSLVQRINPEVIIHTAGLTNADYCEEHREEAYKTNVIGTANIVQVCKESGAKLVYVSSDFVFDGKENNYSEENSPNPLNFYGYTKLEGERLTRKNLEDYLIIRPAILYGDGEKNFISSLVQKLTNGKKVVLDDEIIKYPTLTDDVARLVKNLLESKAKGIYNISGEEAVTKYRWGIKIAQFYNLPQELIERNNSESSAKRPKNVRLENKKIKEFGFDFLAKNVSEGIKILENQNRCAFKLIYSARPDALVAGENASKFRFAVGEELAREHPVEADVVIAIPESGKFGAYGYSKESGIHIMEGIIRDVSHISTRTIYQPSEQRKISLDKKLIMLRDFIEGQRIVLVDEAILSGVTSEKVISKLKEFNAKEIHLRIPSPPMVYSCNNGILEKNRFLVAKSEETKEDIEEKLRAHFGVNSLRYLSLEGFLKQAKLNKPLCVECFYGKRNC